MEKTMVSSPCSARMSVTALYERTMPSMAPIARPRTGDEARLYQEAELDHATAIPDGSQHADLLAPLHDGAGAHHAEGRDADEQAQRHEPGEEPEEAAQRG